MSRLETELITRIEELQTELNEQARLLGMSAERELKLIAEIEQARRTAEYWKAEHLAANAEIERLRADITTREDGAEKMALKGIEMRAEIQRLINERNAFGLAIDRALTGIVPDEHPLRSRLVEIAALKARLVEMWVQMPAYWGPRQAIEYGWDSIAVNRVQARADDVPLYLAPGAQEAI